MRAKLPYVQVGSAKIDIDRRRRCGLDEAIYAPGKTLVQLKKICKFFFSSRKTILLTRLEERQYQELKEAFPKLEYSPIAKAAYFLPRKIKYPFRDYALIISAGTSDMPVAEEAFVTLRVLGVRPRKLYDVGVAGIARLLSHRRLLERSKVIITVAGMDAALVSIVAGLVKVPVIAVPTSCGYGAHFKGLASLLGMLNACASGVGVVNIDNGFGAGVLAFKILRSS